MGAHLEFLPGGFFAEVTHVHHRDDGGHVGGDLHQQARVNLRGNHLTRQQLAWLDLCHAHDLWANQESHIVVTQLQRVQSKGDGQLLVTLNQW